MDDKPTGPGPNDWQRWRGSLDALVEDVRGTLASLSTAIDQIQDRITRIEVRIAWYMGCAFAVGTVLSALATTLLYKGLG